MKSDSPTGAKTLQERIQDLGGDLEQIVETAEAQKRTLEDGRLKGQQSQRDRIKAHHAYWLEQAKRIRANKPYLPLEKVAIEVMDACRQNSIRLKNGRDYQFRTVFDYIKRMKLT